MKNPTTNKRKRSLFAEAAYWLIAVPVTLLVAIVAVSVSGGGL